MKHTHPYNSASYICKTISTNVFFNTSSRSQNVCASNSTHPGLPDMNNRGVKFNQLWKSAAHNCRNKLRLCTIVLSITNFETCRCTPGMSHTLVGQIWATGEYNSLSPEIAQLITAKAVRANSLRIWEQSSNLHLQAGNWKVHIIFIVFCDFTLIGRSGKCHIMLSFTGCAPCT